MDAREHPALLAEEAGRLVGALTYVVDSPRCEVLTLHASEHRRGVGTALLEVEDVARVAGAGSSG